MIKQFNLLDGGYCTHLERMVLKGARMCNAKFPAIFAHLEHENLGHILFDTGYSDRFISETKRLPFLLYRKITPVFFEEKDFAVSKLKNLSINPEDIRYIIISHFHADHIGAVKDFPNAKFIYLEEGYNAVKGLSNFGSVLKGFIPNLLPEDFVDRSVLVDENQLTSIPEIDGKFKKLYDLFGDGSFVGVKLPGHAKGQLGIIFKFNGKRFFLISDSCWMSESFELNKLPSEFSYIIADSKKEYKETVQLLHEVHKETDLVMIPSHCGKKFLEHAKYTHIECGKNMNGIVAK